MFADARSQSPSRARFSVCRLNDENVVKPPQIPAITNCRAGVGNAHPQRVRWTSRSFAQNVIAAENYGAGARAATINTYDQLTQRGKPSRQHVNSWLRDGH